MYYRSKWQPTGRKVAEWRPTRVTFTRALRNYYRTHTWDGNTVTITDKDSGAEKKVNVRMDSLGAMLRDVLNKAGDWIY